VPAYPWHNSMEDPPPTNAVALFEPPPQLAGGRREIWIAASGGEHWGGCDVWGSFSGDSYAKVGNMGPGCVVGIISSALAATADPDTTSEVRVDVAVSRGTLFPASRADADLFATICLVGDELIAYTSAQLIGPHQYRLSGYIRRGVFGSPIGDHAIGERFVRFNESVFRFEFPAHAVGERVYVKLPAYNEFYQMIQSLDQAAAHELVLSGSSVAAP
jgi:hypothetical protein